MRVDTKRRKKARKGFEQMYGVQELAGRMFHILQTGKRGLDSLHMELGAMLCETVMDIEREERSGPEHAPFIGASINGHISGVPFIAGIRRFLFAIPVSGVPRGRFI